MKFRAIRDNIGRFAVSLMCSALGVSPSAYYAWRDRPVSSRARANDQLLQRIREAHQHSRGTYGSPRITHELRAQGHRVGKNRVAGLMRTAQIRAKSARKWRAMTQSAHRLPVAENTLDRQFTVAQPNRVWAGDLTYVWTAQGLLYVAVVLDLHSRSVIGWAMSADLATQALTMALWRRKPHHGGLLYHSDRGVQYAAKDYQQLLAENGIACSMSRKANCWDNAVVESFFHILKVELVHHRRYLTRDEARQDILEWIEVFYNRQRGSFYARLPFTG